MKRRHFLWWVIAGPFAVLIAIMLVAHPYLAITDPSGGDALVVEGWMDPPQLEEAAVLAMDPRYHHVYTTGTIRPFAYYLRVHEGIKLTLDDASGGDLRIDAAGTPGAGIIVVADGDTVMIHEVAPQPAPFRTTLAAGTRELTILSFDRSASVGPAPNVFVALGRVRGTNLHRAASQIELMRADGRTDPAWPTYAHAAKGKLEELGVPADRITAVPSYGKPDSRTWANASNFAVQARRDGLRAFDIATVGVHARRSRLLFQEACGPDIRAGVIALDDPYCRADNWWRSVRGWGTLMKEVIGAPEAQAVELTR